jgi:hypothetical protein
MVLGWWIVIVTFKFMQYTCKAFTTFAGSVRLVLLNKMFSSYQRSSHDEKEASQDTYLYHDFLCFGPLNTYLKYGRFSQKHPVSCANTAEYCCCEEYLDTAVRGYASRMQ